MEKYVEAYGAVYKKLFFFAVRFQKTILKVKVAHPAEHKTVLNTPHILVVYSKAPVIIPSDQNTLTFVVRAPCSSNAISVESGKESELLMALLNKENIAHFCFHHSVLYGCGNRHALSFAYKPLPRTTAFKTLHTLTLAHQLEQIQLHHFVACRVFKRNHLKWENWHSWWSFIQGLLRESFETKTGQHLTLQNVGRLRKLWNASLRCPIEPQTELTFCEIGLDDTEAPGILCASDAAASTLSYVSPMIVGEQFCPSLPIKDINNVRCNLWFPLYTHRDAWFERTLYFYAHPRHARAVPQILDFLRNRNVEKYRRIETNIGYIRQLLI